MYNLSLTHKYTLTLYQGLSQVSSKCFSNTSKVIIHSFKKNYSYYKLFMYLSYVLLLISPIRISHRSPGFLPPRWKTALRKLFLKNNPGTCRLLLNKAPSSCVYSGWDAGTFQHCHSKSTWNVGHHGNTMQKGG